MPAAFDELHLALDRRAADAVVAATGPRPWSPNVARPVGHPSWRWPRGRRRWGQPGGTLHRLRHPVAAAAAVAVLATGGVAAAAVATDHLPGPTRAVAYDLGLPVTSPALVTAARGTLAELQSALAAGDPGTIRSAAAFPPYRAGGALPRRQGHDPGGGRCRPGAGRRRSSPLPADRGRRNRWHRCDRVRRPGRYRHVRRIGRLAGFGRPVAPTGTARKVAPGPAGPDRHTAAPPPPPVRLGQVPPVRAGARAGAARTAAVRTMAVRTVAARTTVRGRRPRRPPRDRPRPPPTPGVPMTAGATTAARTTAPDRPMMRSCRPRRPRAADRRRSVAGGATQRQRDQRHRHGHRCRHESEHDRPPGRGTDPRGGRGAPPEHPGE